MEGKKSARSKSKQKEQSQLSEEEKSFVEHKKKKAIVKTHGIDNTSTFEHPASFTGTTRELEKTSLRNFIEQCDIDIIKLDDEEIIFDLVGVEPPLANALRRILIAEIPTMAIEKVNMWQNTSIIPDENLAHRMGLIPIKADPRQFEFHVKAQQDGDEDQGDQYNENDSLRFKLHVRCTKKDPRAPMIINNTVDEDKHYNNANVYSGQLKWIPVGNQKQKYGENGIKPLFDDILIAKLRPGQEIEMELICEKGIGKTHAKWSPVSTAYYRLVPDITITKDITGDDAEELKRLCPTGVYDIEDLGGKKGKRAYVANVRNCTTCRECIRPEKFRERIELAKLKDRFEFHVESVGIYRPEDLVVEALKILKEKANYWLEVLEHENEVDEDEAEQNTQRHGDSQTNDSLANSPKKSQKDLTSHNLTDEENDEQVHQTPQKQKSLRKSQTNKSTEKKASIKKHTTFADNTQKKEEQQANYVLSDEEEDKERKKMNRASKRRFGHTVKFEKYKTSNLIKIICITLAIIIIPLEIFVQNVLQDAEGTLIQKIQASFGQSESLEIFMRIPIWLVRPETTCFFMFFFYLATDSLIAFKNAILTCFGFYFITFLKLLYKDGRPFWIKEDIIGYECFFDFAAPGYHLYILTFFWAYNIIMYCMKYAEKVNNLLVGFLFTMLTLMGFWVVLSGLYNGTIFIYQNVIGMLYGFIMLVLALNFDTEIHRLCEKTGFIVQSSRKYKFYLFFVCIGMFVVALIYYNSELDQWTMPQTWVVNASQPEKYCKELLLQTSNNRLGLDQTFDYTGILFFITGMGFGTSYSLVHVDCIDWVHTSWKLRLVRGILGTAITVGIYFLFLLIPCNDNPTKYFFQFAIPSLLLSFFIYGIFPILCLKISLVKQHNESYSFQVQQSSIPIKKEDKKKQQLLETESQESESDEDKKGGA